VLIHECEVFTRYLVKQMPSSTLVSRYAEASSILLPGPHHPSDEALIRFIRRNPKLVPYLDAAAAVFRPHSLLRKKILLTVALLEATPDYTRFFFDDGRSTVRVLATLAGIGCAGALKVLVGCVLYPVAVNVK
jgi:hypothetical protein